MTAVVDATHPFVVTISAHAVAATARTATPLLRLRRPGWRNHPDAAAEPGSSPPLRRCSSAPPADAPF
ncbi:MAG: precorrin-6A/cobalt-precorrin-6A reductase [Microlunatus sp.]|nr:precorrin-6A/cobalt-precorrin-6A reductase [Microlunatus sp.]MDN5769826.1 precorrin-6A/cobalt-precorrin-6A reductase [Microlunatus sp.]